MWEAFRHVSLVCVLCLLQIYELFVAVRKLDLQFSMIVMLTGFVFFNSTDDRVFLIPNVKGRGVLSCSPVLANLRLTGALSVAMGTRS